MKILVVAPKVPTQLNNLIQVDDFYVIAVDQAVSELNNQAIQYHLAVGDFDSLSDTKEIHSDILKLNPIKDESDTYKAIEIAYTKSDDVTLLGGLAGPRIDHLYANLLLLQRFPNLTIMDEHNKIEIKPKGTYAYKKNAYNYISLFAIEDTIITLEGTKYLLDHYLIKKDNPIGLSNEIEDEATIHIHDGLLLVIQSKD